MLKKRIIPCLDIKNGRTVKGTNFEQLRDAGDPVELASLYANQGADELVFLDITANNERRSLLFDLIRNIASVINIPFTVGGGVQSVNDVYDLLHAGADKISINSAAVKDRELITILAKEFGSQCIVVAIDTKSCPNPLVHIKGGKQATTLDTVTWAKDVCSLGAGEILLTSMDKDGTKDGFDLEITKQVAQAVDIPVIASGGAGQINDFINVFQQTEVTGALAASIFHFQLIGIHELKENLFNHNIPVRI